MAVVVCHCPTRISVRITALLIVSMVFLEASCLHQRLQAKRCRFSLIDMSIGRITLTDVSLNLRIAVFNPGRVTAVIDRMDLWLTCKGERTARMSIGSLTIPPGGTKIADSVVEVPYCSLGMSLGGEDSQRPPCSIQGKAFVNLPGGEVSIPVTIGRD